MNRLCHKLMGMDLQHISELENALKNPKNGIQIINPINHIYRFLSDEVWKFSKSTIMDADGNAYTQVQAIDVTTLCKIEKELEQENHHLEEVNARARKLYAELDNIIREEENFFH